ncbi:MYADM protein, partial [Polyodon spathula]|nr:myeloid-associated differentiation marker homolog [Polyodon spathula]XP_041095258.1 myeloid-associated differentiation marker homolog [Polyodon spathula]MBN3284612.1 MYADM protein [Polyodon spathula]
MPAISPAFSSSPLLFARLAAVLFTCVTFSLVVHCGSYGGGSGDWCLFCWCFSFVGSLVVLLVEVLGLQSRAPVSWRNFPITFATYAALFCLSASIIYPLYFLKDQYGSSGSSRDYRIAASVFSCLATLAYVVEVSLSRARPGEVAGYMATAPGLLKVCETFVACVIFVFLDHAYERHAALKWCLAVYCICFIVSATVIVLCVGECTGCLPFPFDRFLSAYALLAALLYGTATIIWPLFNFDSNHLAVRRDRSCGQGRSLCLWETLVAVSVLTALNFLLYLADLFYSARLVFIKV